MEAVSDEDLARRLQKEEEEHYTNLTAARELQADEDHKYAAFLAQQLNPSPNVGHGNHGQNNQNRGHGSGIHMSGRNLSVNFNINMDDMTSGSNFEIYMEAEETEDEEEDEELEETEESELEEDEEDEVTEEEEEVTEEEDEETEEEDEETEEEEEEDDDQDDDLHDSEYEIDDDDLDDPMNRTNNKGLTYNQIGILPTRTFVAHPQRQGTSSLNTSGQPGERECPVCFSAFDDGDLIRTLPCLHHFHSACVDVWLQRQADCPVCRAKIRLDSNY